MSEEPISRPGSIAHRKGGRRWYTSVLLIWSACGRTINAFHDHKIGSLTPLFFVLLMFAVVLYLINAIAPIAPFVYSLI
jgi:hypothetical protein